jgi:hypothetical protein
MLCACGGIARRWWQQGPIECEHDMNIKSKYVPSLDQAAAKAAKMPSSRANTAVDLMAVGG